MKLLKEETTKAKEKENRPIDALTDVGEDLVELIMSNKIFSYIGEWVFDKSSLIEYPDMYNFTKDGDDIIVCLPFVIKKGTLVRSGYCWVETEADYDDGWYTSYGTPSYFDIDFENSEQVDFINTCDEHRKMLKIATPFTAPTKQNPFVLKNNYASAEILEIVLDDAISEDSFEDFDIIDVEESERDSAYVKAEITEEYDTLALSITFRL